MQLTRDFFRVAVDKVFETTTTPSGITTSNTAVIDPNQENRGYYKRRYGTVLEVPVEFTDQVVDVVDPGSPSPKCFVGHSHIMGLINMGYQVSMAQSRYYPSTIERYDVITRRDLAKKVNVKVGDRVYFMEHATDEERHLGSHKGKEHFAVAVDEIQLVVKKKHIFVNHQAKLDHDIFAQGRWVLVKPDMESWEDITLPSGIIAKVAPGAKWELVPNDENTNLAPTWQMTTEGKPLQGFVRATNRKDLKVGDKIIFQRDADAPITVEGEELTIMHEDDILAKIRK